MHSRLKSEGVHDVLLVCPPDRDSHCPRRDDCRLRALPRLYV